MNNELKKLGEKTYCIENPVIIGIYLLDDNNVCVIDTGSSKDYGKMIDKVLTENNWNLKIIINTHSHADHINGNRYLQNKYNCKIYCSQIESYFINKPILEPALMYGASPIKDMTNHFLMASESICDDISLLNVEGLSIINLEGHSLGQIGIVTSDNVCFVGDAYSGIDKIEKYAIQYIFDIDNYLKSLDLLLNSNYDIYVPSHGLVEDKENAMKTISKNKEVCLGIRDNLLNIIGNSISYSNLIKKVFEIYNIKINPIQYYLISSTIRAYLKSLESLGLITLTYIDNELFLQKTTI